MAKDFLKFLQTVPWNEVVANAPKIAEGAQRLWSRVGKRTEEPMPAASRETSPLSLQEQAVSAIESQLAAMKVAGAELQAQMLASSELIQALAEQNTLLIDQMKTHAMQITWLRRFTIGASATALASLLVALLR